MVVREDVQELEKLYANMILEEEADGGICYEEGGEESSKINAKWCLDGKFLTERSLDFEAMKHQMASLWRLEKGVYIKKLGENLYLFQLYQEVDVQRIIERSPWTFDMIPLIFKLLQEGESQRMVTLNSLDMWV